MSSVSSVSEGDQSDSDQFEVEERVHLSHHVVLFPNKTLTEHGNVLEGEIISDVAHGRHCAIKFPTLSDQTVKEVEALQILGCHSHIITLLESGIHQDSICEHSYIALEKCHERNLRQHLLHRKQTLPVFDISWALKFCRQIIDGMTFVHEKLIIHKDLKPSNILLTHDLESIKIADFGSSQVVKTTSSMVYCQNMFGTLGFRPPESFGGSYASLKSDTFSLGALFYFLLSDGESPFGNQSELWDHNVRNAVINISGLKVSNPIATEHLIKMMLSHDRRRRPSIWQIAAHPCWRGGECECAFDYGETEEDDCDVAGEVPLDVREDEEDIGLQLFIEAYRKWQAIKRNQTRSVSPVQDQTDRISIPPEEISSSQLTVGRYLRSGYLTHFSRGTWKDMEICIEERIPFVPESATIFERKLRALTELRHRNIVRLLATTTDIPRRLVLELTEFDNFRSYLQKKKTSLNEADLWNYSHQIASGMSYIASMNYVHGSLRASAILIGGDGLLKISRFRLTHRMGEVVQNWRELNPSMWSAPEVLSSGKFSHKSDVWSFGVVLYEIFSYGALPNYNVRTDDVGLLNFLKSGQRLGKPPNVSEDIYGKMRECWEFDPNKRPDFPNLQTSLKRSSEEYLQK